MIAAALVASPAFAGEYDEFRACVEAVDEAAVTATFHHCTGALAQPCGASATAKEAAACIDGERAGIETEIEAQIAVLSRLSGDAPAEVRDALSGNRSAGEASCALMAQRDAATNVAIGQRAVNGAFCRLIVSGDVLGFAYRLESNE